MYSERQKQIHKWQQGEQCIKEKISILLLILIKNQEVCFHLLRWEYHENENQTFQRNERYLIREKLGLSEMR